MLYFDFLYFCVCTFVLQSCVICILCLYILFAPQLCVVCFVFAYLVFAPTMSGVICILYLHILFVPQQCVVYFVYWHLHISFVPKTMCNSYFCILVLQCYHFLISIFLYLYLVRVLYINDKEYITDRICQIIIIIFSLLGPGGWTCI